MDNIFVIIITGISLLFLATYCIERKGTFIGWIISLVMLCFLIALPINETVMVYNYIINNPELLAVSVIGYLFIGIGYVVSWRYPVYITDHKDDINRMYKKRLASNPDVSKEDFLESKFYTDIYGPYGNKDKIITWMSWWPLSLLYHLSHRPVRFVYNKVYNIISKLLVKVFNKTSKNILD